MVYIKGEEMTEYVMKLVLERWVGPYVVRRSGRSRAARAAAAGRTQQRARCEAGGWWHGTHVSAGNTLLVGLAVPAGGGLGL